MWVPTAKPLSLCQWVSPGNTLILPSQLQTGNPLGTLWNSPLQLCLADTSSKLPRHQRVTLAGTTDTVVDSRKHMATAGVGELQRTEKTHVPRLPPSCVHRISPFTE